MGESGVLVIEDGGGGAWSLVLCCYSELLNKMEKHLMTLIKRKTSLLHIELKLHSSSLSQEVSDTPQCQVRHFAFILCKV